MSGEIMETRMRATLVVAVLVVVYPGVAFAQLAPQSQAEFEQRFTGWTVQSDAPDCNEGDGIDPITFIEPGRFDVNGFLEGDYEYERTGANTGTLTVTLDFFPIPQVIDLTFNSQTMGTFTVAVFGVACEGSFEFVESTPGKPQTEDRIYYFPHLAVGASWQTTITYINYSPEEVSCQTDFISDHGSPLMVSFAELGTVDSRTDVLPPGGSVHQETNVDLSASLAPGWARATCSGPVKASLLFRRRNSEGAPTAEAGVNAAAVPATRFVTFAEQGEGQFGTGVAYANPSATAALVTFTARDTAGEVLPSVNRTLSPGGHAAHGMSELFDLTSFTGSIEVTSTEPIVSLSLNFEADPVFSSLPSGELDASAQGSTTYYFPHLAVGASWQTTITYINYSPQEVSCQTDFISDQGTPLMVSFAALGTVDSRTDVLPPGGSVHQETNVDLNASLAPGWARATCSGPVKASLLFRRRNSEGAPTAEAGVNAAAVPATRFVTFAEQGEGQFGTGVAYANPSATAALVTFTARDAAGEVLPSVNRTLSPGGHAAHGMSELFDLTSFTGSIEVTSTEPIVSLSLNFEADPVFSSLPPGETPAVSDTPSPLRTTGPSLVSAVVENSGDTITLTFDENIDSSSLPFPLHWAISITADDESVDFSSSASGASGATTIALREFSPLITPGQSVVVSYADPTPGDDEEAIQDTAGNDAASFAVTATNNSTTIDTTPPSLVSAVVDAFGDQITLTFDERLGRIFDRDSFVGIYDAVSVTADGESVSVIGFAVASGTTSLEILLSAQITRSQTVVVAYTDPTPGNDKVAIQDAAGNDAASFTENVINNSTVP